MKNRAPSKLKYLIYFSLILFFVSFSLASFSTSKKVSSFSSGEISLNIISPQNTTYNTRSVLLNLTAINATSVVYSLDGTSLVNYTSPVMLTINPERSHNITVIASNNLNTVGRTVYFSYVNTSINYVFNIPNQTWLDFDGDGDYVQAANFSWASGGPVSVLFWNKVNTNQLKSSSVFSINSTDFPNRFQAHAPNWDKKLYWDYGDNYNVSGRLSADYTSYLNKWTHVALTSEGNGGAFRGIYFDGLLANSSFGASDGPDIELRGLSIGRFDYFGLPKYHNGSVDEFMIFNRVLNESEINLIYNAGKTTDLAVLGIRGLVVYYSFNEGAGNVVSDTSGNGNNGVRYNATWNNGAVLNKSKVNITLVGSDYILFNNTDVSNNFSITFSNLTNALIYYGDGSIGGNADIKANSNNVTIIIPAGWLVYLFDNFVLTEGAPLERSPISLSFSNSTTKHIASSLSQTINASVKIRVDSCSIVEIYYKSNSSAFSKTYSPSSFSCSGNLVTLYLENIEPAESSNELVVKYSTVETPSSGGGGGGGGGGGSYVQPSTNLTINVSNNLTNLSNVSLPKTNLTNTNLTTNRSIEGVENKTSGKGLFNSITGAVTGVFQNRSVTVVIIILAILAIAWVFSGFLVPRSKNVGKEIKETT